MVLFLDAGNPKSYPGSGTTWVDLTKNGNNGTLINGPTFSSDNGGSIVFDGSGKKTTISIPFGQSGYTTVSIWYKRDEANSSTTWRTLFATSSTNIHHLISKQTTRELGIFDGSFRDFGYTPPIDNNFHNYTVIYQSGVNASLYVDGLFSSTVTTSLNLVTSPIGIIGNWVSNSYWAGSLNLPSIYNRALTVEEILQNYNATRSRFGI